MAAKLIQPQLWLRAIYRQRFCHGRAKKFLGEVRSDLNLRRERAMHGAFVGDLQQTSPLRRIERPGEFNSPLDAVDLAFLGLTFRAVCSVDLGVRQRDADVLKGPFLVAGVKAQSHRRAGS